MLPIFSQCFPDLSFLNLLSLIRCFFLLGLLFCPFASTFCFFRQNLSRCPILPQISKPCLRALHVLMCSLVHPGSPHRKSFLSFGSWFFFVDLSNRLFFDFHFLGGRPPFPKFFILPVCFHRRFDKFLHVRTTILFLAQLAQRCFVNSVSCTLSR